MIDNLCFFRMRTEEALAKEQGGDPEQAGAAEFMELCNSLTPEIAAHANTYRLVVDVRRGDADYSNNTSVVSGEQRLRVRQLLDQFLVNHNIKSVPVELNKQRFEADLEAATSRLLNTVRDVITGDPAQ